MLNLLLDILFPRRCLSCGAWGRFICPRCRASIEYFDKQVCPYCERPSLCGLTHPRCQKRFGLDGMFVLAHYRGPMVPVLRGIKYHDTFAACGELAEMMAAKYHYKYSFDCFVPIPLSKSRERERGYNQAEKLAGALKQIMDNRYEMKDKKIENGDREQEGKKPLPAVVPLLQRIRETKPQFDLTYKERRKNVRGAFAVATRYLPLATSLCLVDDVATTGATVFECAKVLKRAGAKYVYALCAARGG